MNSNEELIRKSDLLRFADVFEKRYENVTDAYGRKMPIKYLNMKGLRYVLSRLPIYTLPFWRDAKNDPPPCGAHVLCFFQYPDLCTICENIYYGSGRWLQEGTYVTHWMPLPNPPPEKQGDDLNAKHFQ